MTRKPLLGVAMVVASGALFAVNGTVSKLVLRSGFDAPQLTLLRAAGGGRLRGTTAAQHFSASRRAPVARTEK